MRGVRRSQCFCFESRVLLQGLFDVFWSFNHFNDVLKIAAFTEGITKEGI